MQNERQSFARGALAIGAILLGLVAVEFGLELYRFASQNNGALPSAKQLSWQGVNNAKLVDSLSPIARAYNNILAMLVGMVGLAIPLTANMHTPKLIDLFLRDRINRIVLSVMAIGAGNVLFVLYIIGPEFAPVWSYRLAIAGALLGWVLLIPYFFYVVRFLDPSHVIHRLQAEAVALIARAKTSERNYEVCQQELRERLFQLGTLIIKSIDRTDRAVAREGIWALKEIACIHLSSKDKFETAWFEVRRDDFVGMSHYALSMMTQERTWVESQILYQLMLCSQRAMRTAPDAVSAITNVNRKIAVEAHERGDTHVVMQCIRLFNTCLSESMRQKDTRTALDILYQYRRLAADLHRDSDKVCQIGNFFAEYAELAENLGRTFVAQFIAFDLCKVMRQAFRADNPAAGELLDALLSLPNEIGGELDSSRLRAKLLAAGFFRELNLEAELNKVRNALRPTPPAQLKLAGQQLAKVEERAFWEITDRAINMEWASAQRRKHIAEFVCDMCS
jgi:hypothetical protein